MCSYTFKVCSTGTSFMDLTENNRPTIGAEHMGARNFMLHSRKTHSRKLVPSGNFKVDRSKWMAEVNIEGVSIQCHIVSGGLSAFCL